MRLYKMTATFGKLEHETLTLQPGLNVITAPNEWGKSTWCAFLMAMLYGIDTRVKSTKTTLADDLSQAHAKKVRHCNHAVTIRTCILIVDS